VDISQASAIRAEPWAIHGKYGSVVSDEAKNEFIVRTLDPKSLPEAKAHEGLAAADRKYNSFGELKWQTKVVPISDFEPLDYYQLCYDYFALNHPPFVPIAETREVMRLLEACEC